MSFWEETLPCDIVTTSSSFSFSPHLLNKSSSSSFLNRTDAGQVLAACVAQKLQDSNALVLALPRGGVPVASEIAKTLHLALDIFLVRKFSLPDHPDQILGTVASGGVHTVDSAHSLSSTDLEALLAREQTELSRREEAYRQARPAQSVTGRTIIVVDDGLTTGFTMRSAIRALRLLEPAEIIAAIPVASAEICSELSSIADSVICARTPAAFTSVRRCYADFSPILDDEIRHLLATAESDTGLRAFRA